MTMKKITAYLLTVLMLLSLTACAEKSASTNLFAMDTYMSLTAYGSNAQTALTDASRRINELERMLSRTVAESDVSKLNESRRAAVSDETAALLGDALQYAAKTDGAFDMTIAPIVNAWGITSDTPRVPDSDEIAALLTHVGSNHVHLDGNTVTLDGGCAIDLGGIAKGYASDCVASIFADYGITSGCVSLGGNVYVCGNKPDGDKWLVAIQDPQGDDYAAMVALSDAFAVTSGGYQRYFTAEDGTVYQHIIDPKTGYPVQSDLLSVTVIADNGTMADAYSTALYVMGERGAVDFWRANADCFDVVMITTDGRLLYTPNLQDQITEPEGTTYDFQVIDR